MSNTNTSRRNFLSTLAILTSGSLVAGSPANILDVRKAGNASLKKSWKQFLQQNEANVFIDVTDKCSVQHQLPITGMKNVAGELVSLPGLGLLAQPSWIHWNKNSNLPDDVVVHFYETEYPFKRLKSINRFELQTLAQLPASSAAVLAKALCLKPTDASKKQSVVTTKVAKQKATQFINVKSSSNENLITDQYIYNI